MFTFSFTSDKVGMFNEEWELWTEPFLLNQLPVLALCGISTQEDLLEEKRENFWKQFDVKFMQHDAEETMGDLIERVKTPTKSPPDYHDSETFADAFEKRNREMGLYFTQRIMDGFYELIEDIEIIYER